MKRRTRNWGLLTILALVLLTGLPQTGSAASNALTDKASPAVWQASAEGQAVNVLILLEQETALTAQAKALSQLEQREHVYQSLYQHAELSQRSLRTWLEMRAIDYHPFYIVNAIQAQLTEQDISALVQRSDVKRIITNPTIHTDLPQTEPTYSVQSTSAIAYGITMINADDVWAQGFTGQGIVIAGQDTGYDWDHEALINNYRGWDGNTASHEYNWHDAIHSSTGSCGCNSPEPCDDNSHGTHTMGTMIADVTAPETLGVAPGAQWIGCRNMDGGNGTPTTYIECFEFFMAPYPVGETPAQGNVSKAPHIINNSWSCPTSEGCDEYHTGLMEQVVENVRAAGIMVVVSATNRGSSCDTITDPAAIYDASYTIAATDMDDVIAVFSSRGLPGSGKPNLSAPGVNTLSSTPGDNYGYKSGTSMAAPHVAGATALLWSAHPGLIGDIDTTEAILNATAKPLYSVQCGDTADATPNSVYGWGRLDVEAAVNAGIITGTITSNSGTPLSGALISVQSISDTIQTSTSLTGTYSFIIPNGTYTLTVTLDGYDPTSATDITLKAGEIIVQDFSLTTPCNQLKELSIAHSPTQPLHGQQGIYTATVTSGKTPINYTWAFTDTLLVGNPITQALYWDIAMPTYTLGVTATNPCGVVTTTQAIEVLAPQRLFLPVIIK